MRMLLVSRPYERSRIVARPAITIAATATMTVLMAARTNLKLGLKAE